MISLDNTRPSRGLRITLFCAAIGFAAALALGVCLNTGTAYADDDVLQSGVSEQTAITPAATTGDSAANGTLADDTKVTDASGEDIDAFDLRHATEDTDGTLTSKTTYNEGDSQSTFEEGNNYVTPVKLQNPWGSCWAFSSTAASETSLLTSLDQADDGKMNGSITYEIAAAWAKLDLADDGKMNGSIDYGSVSANTALLAEYATDLSERHLAWFAFYDVSEDSPFPDQAGEGKYLVDGSKDVSAIYNDGGMPWLSLSEYSSGIGPVPEWYAPYTNDEGYYQVATPALNEAKTDLIYKYFTSYDEALAYQQDTWNDDVIKKFNENNGTAISSYTVLVRRAAIGTWGLDDSKAYIIAAELTNSNILDQNLSTTGLTAQEIILMKQELLAGHSISIAYTADQSKPGQVLGKNTYLNTDNWAQYTYDNVRISHAVTIIGYDDNYSADNFTHNIYKTDSAGNVIYQGDEPVVDEENTGKTKPAGNGAWIVKNSWGCLDSDDPTQVMNWGINGTGYFYLSYYDKTISNMESYEYDVSAEAQERMEYVAYQYDLANVSSYQTQITSEVSKMCNVFNGPEQGEGSVSIRDLGFVTGAAGDTATIEVYVIDDDADVVAAIESGNPVVTVSENFENAGFHRIHLEDAIVILPNQKFAIVQTNQRSDGKYEYVAMGFYNEEFVKAFNDIYAPLNQVQLSYYEKTVVNDGESLLYLADDDKNITLSNDSSWKDWNVASSDLNGEKTAAMINDVKNSAAQYRAMAQMYKAAGLDEIATLYEQVAKNCENFSVRNVYAYDNFCIKAYADESGIDISKAMAAAVDGPFTYNGSEYSPKVLVSMGGKALTEGVDYVLSGDLEATEAGTYEITVTGIGQYYGTTTLTWNIVAQNVPEDDCAAIGTRKVSYALPATGDNTNVLLGFAGAVAVCEIVFLFLVWRRREN